MSKNMLFKVLIALCFVAVAVVWALSAAEVITVRLDWLIAVFAFVLACSYCADCSPKRWASPKSSG